MDKISEKTKCPFVMCVPMSWCKHTVVERTMNRLLKQNFKAFILPLFLIILLALVGFGIYMVRNNYTSNEDARFGAISNSLEGYEKEMSKIKDLNSLGNFLQHLPMSDQFKTIIKVSRETGALVTGIRYSNMDLSIPKTVKGNFENAIGKKTEEVIVEGVWILTAKRQDAEKFNQNWVTNCNRIVKDVFKGYDVKAFVDIVHGKNSGDFETDFAVVFWRAE